jgi:DNA-binding response OmpR family regulator
MKVLLITTPRCTGNWLAEAFAADGASQILLDEVISESDGLARLRDEVFDAILVNNDPDALDALELAEAIRAGGHDEPLLILGSDPQQSMDALSFEAGADDYCCIAETTVRGLLWKFARAIHRFNLTRENRRLLQAERQRLQQEHQEVERLLEQQRELIADLARLSEPNPFAESIERDGNDLLASFDSTSKPAGDHSQLPADLIDHYRELLRAYVIMGAGNLTDEMTALGQLLAQSSVTAQRTIQLHVQVLEELVQGLGNRSARHVINRADLLALEVMSHLADGYRRRYHERQP